MPFIRSVFYSEALRDLYREGRFPEYIRHCSTILDQVREQCGSESLDLAYLYEDMERGFIALGDMPGTVEVTKAALRVYCAKTETRSHCIRQLVNLAEWYRRLGLASEAMVTVERALELVSSLPRQGQWQRGIVLMTLSELETDRYDFLMAEQHLLEAAKLLVAQLGWTHSLFGRVFYLLGIVYWNTGRRFAAERSLRKAIRIYREDSCTRNYQYPKMLVTADNAAGNCGSMVKRSVSTSTGHGSTPNPVTTNATASI